MLVLLVLADHANGEGGSAYPSVSRIAKFSRLGESTVRAALVELCNRGIIELTREATNKLPAFYRFPLFSRGAESGGPESGGPESSSLGVQNLESRGAVSAPEPSMNHQESTTTTTRALGAAAVDNRAAQKNGNAPQKPMTPLAREQAEAYWSQGRNLAAFEAIREKHPKALDLLAEMGAWRRTVGDRGDEQFLRMVWHAIHDWNSHWTMANTAMQHIPSFKNWIERELWASAPKQGAGVTR
jgi:hypothetical protein